MSNPAVFTPSIPLSHYLHGWPRHKLLGHVFIFVVTRQHDLTGGDIVALRETGRVHPASPGADAINAAADRLEDAFGPGWWWITVAQCRAVLADPTVPACCCGYHR
jgi:hypothetical protein